MYLGRIRDLRTDHNLTQQQVADLLGCNLQVYRRYEKGYREIPIWCLIKLAGFFQVSVDYLLELTNETTAVNYVIEASETSGPCSDGCRLPQELLP